MVESMCRKVNPPTLLVGSKLVQLLWKTVWSFLKQKRKLSYDPGILLLDIYLEKTLTQKCTCTPMFVSALFIITMNMEDMEAT